MHFVKTGGEEKIYYKGNIVCAIPASNAQLRSGGQVPSTIAVIVVALIWYKLSFINYFFCQCRPLGGTQRENWTVESTLFFLVLLYNNNKQSKHHKPRN
jgi:hypothetical protein